MPTPSKSLEISRGTRAPRIAPSEPPESVSSAESCDPCPSLPSTCQVRATRTAAHRHSTCSTSQKGVPRLGTYTHTMLPPVWWYAQSAVELSWSDESRSSTRMCVLLVEGYLLQRTRDKRRAINMSPTWSRSRVVMSPGETPRDGYHPISHGDCVHRVVTKGTGQPNKPAEALLTRQCARETSRMPVG